MKNIFEGTGVAIITPFKSYKIDYKSLEKMVNHVIEGGVTYIVVLGSTGEAATLSYKEQEEVLALVKTISREKVPLVAGNFAGINTAEIVERVKSFDFEGYDALLVSSPAYVKPSQEGIYRHYIEIAEVSPVPIILYNVPGRTSSNIEWQTAVKLASHPNIIGIKEASGNISQCTKIIANKPNSFFVTSGDDESALALTAIGGCGVISVIANALPDQFSKMINYSLEGNQKEANKLNNHTFGLHEYLYKEGNPVGIKAACEILGLCTKEVRLPLVSLSDNVYEKLKLSLHHVNK
jgi:4-hydroxy-tetrahydrodipicolinate synthase